MTPAAVERAVKLQAPPGFALPDLTTRGLTPVAMPAAELVASCYDTVTRRLARWGMTASHRTERGRTGWALTLPPAKGATEGWGRREVVLPGEPGAPPPGLRALVAAVTRGEPLELVAVVATERRGVHLADGAGSSVVEVAVDDVVVRDTRATAVTTFGEVEARAFAGARHDVLGAVVKRLERAGAGPPDPTPKLFRVWPEPVEPEVPERLAGRAASVGDLFATAVAGHVRRLVVHLPGVVLGEDPDDVRQARVALRRLRSDLSTFERWLVVGELDRLREDLRWAAAVMGGVRDADVLSGRLRADARGFDGPDRAAAQRLLARLDRRRRRHRGELVAAMGSPVFLALVDRLVGLAQAPPLADGAQAKAARVARSIVARPWKRLVEAVHAVPPTSAADPDALHAVWVAAKRARYAAEAVAPVAPGTMATPARRLARLQDVLGDVQDAVVAEAWLRSVVARASPEEAFVAGRLAAANEARLHAAITRWPARWARVERAAAALR